MGSLLGGGSKVTSTPGEAPPLSPEQTQLLKLEAQKGERQISLFDFLSPVIESQVFATRNLPALSGQLILSELGSLGAFQAPSGAVGSEASRGAQALPGTGGPPAMSLANQVQS